MISHSRFSRGYGLLPFSLYSFLLTNITRCQSDKGFSTSPGWNGHSWHIMAQSFTIGEMLHHVLRVYKLNCIVIICKGCKPDRSDHRVVFFQPHLGESAPTGTSWHKVSPLVKSTSCLAGYSRSLVEKSLLFSALFCLTGSEPVHHLV